MKANNQFVFLLAFFFCGLVFAQEQSEPGILSIEPDPALEKLKKDIAKVVDETRIPSVGIALVNEQGVVWVDAFGKANIEQDIAATPDTLYRIGSTSKMFVALAILKLQEEGRLSLNDTLASLVPEVKFTNPWEDTNPVRLVHLLEHTSGWDDMHIVEYAHSQATPIDLKSGLAFHPHSRTSRWVPGTRMAYCNSGPGVAAYVVEQVTGQKFEDYIEENFFKPIGMEGASYFLDDSVQRLGATLYSQGGTPEAYWHILLRPAGSINASPNQMAQFLRLFLGRGSLDGNKILSPESLDRMERPQSNPGAAVGVRLGYGLHNYSSNHKNWHYREHNGGMKGGLSGFAYLPEAGVGYSILMNAGNGRALNRITVLIRDYQTANLTIPVVEKERELSDEQRRWAGHYVAINPRSEMAAPIAHLFRIFKVSFLEDKMRITPMLGDWVALHYPVGEKLFKSDYTGAMHLALVNDPIAGDVIHMENAVLAPISAFWVYFRLLVLVLWTITVLSSLVYLIVWLILRANKHPSSRLDWQIHIWPLLASVSVLLAIALNIAGAGDPFNAFGQPSVYSVGVKCLSYAFVLFSGLAIVAVMKEFKSGINRLLYVYFCMAATLHLFVSIYLMKHGLVGITTWA